MKPKKRFQLNKLLACLLCVLLSVSLLSTISVNAKSELKVVRVGWFESPFNTLDDLGRRSGYSYEYQQRVCVYTNWKYEYVEGSWSELMDMLEEGRIDLLSDVSYTEERSEKMLFSALPMGAEDYYLFTTPDNSEISASDLSTFNGKRVGANEGSVQVDYFKRWAQDNNVNAELVELSGTESNNIARLISGDIDMYLTLDAIADKSATIPVCKIASSDFFFAVNKNRPDLLSELNSAMSRIQDDNRFYNQSLYTKYLNPTSLNSYLSNKEIKWLEKHGKIKIGYQDNYLAFCAKDPKTGELMGGLNDYLKTACESIKNAKPEFEAIAYPTAQDALDALKKGEIDCMFPANLTDYYGETKGLSLSSPLMNTEMSIIVSQTNQDLFNKERVTVAVNAGNPNYEMFLLDYFPEWRSLYFKDTKECLKAISQGKADCLFMSSFRLSDIADLCDKYNLVSISAGVEMDYCIAVERSNATLYSIINKMISVVPDNTMSIALSRYSIKESKSGFSEYIRSQPGVFALIILVILLAILLAVLYNIRIFRRAKSNRELISATETNELTGLYMKNYFFEYANRLYNETPDIPRDAIVVNIIRFHSVNAIGGRSFGDYVLRELAVEISAFVEEFGGIAGHTESDQFAIYCPHMENCRNLFDRLQNKLSSLSTSSDIRLRMGVMPWEKGTEPQELFEHALIACNIARGLYKENLVVFDENMRRLEEFEEQLLNDLRRAVDEEELQVYFQPKFDIQTDPPMLQSAEALVRWNHPKYGMISSSKFISLFEKNGKIGIIDNYVWDKTAEQASKWKEKYGFTLPISINLSRLDVFDSALEETLEGLLEKYNITSDALELEVTESAYTEDSEEIIEIIESLREKGFKVQMDDFGSGYSSLNMLSSMPIDALKMDKAFIKDLSFNNKRIQLVELIIDIAEDLNVPVIAEGVENEEQLKLLQDLGCEIAQGYYFSKAIPAEKFEKKYLDK